MNITEIISGATVFGGAVFGIIKYVNNVKNKLQKEHNDCVIKNNELEKRVIILEAETDSGFPEWQKDSQGRWIYVNGEFVRFYLAPYRKDFSDIQNKTNVEIDFFSEDLKITLDEMDKEVIVRGFAWRSNIRFHEKSSPAVVIKKVVTVKGSSIIFYRGIACPQL